MRTPGATPAAKPGATPAAKPGATPARRPAASSPAAAAARKRPRTPPDRTTLVLIGAAALAVVVIVFVLVTAPRQPTPGSAAMRTTLPPWSADTINLRARLDAIGLPALSVEGQVQHTHQHLDLYVDGVSVTIPANIGVNGTERFISPLHTHDERGIIHVESPEVRVFTLGQFFDVWGVRLDAHCIGGACDGDGRTLTLYVNGELVPGDPRAVKLVAHQEIVLAVGTPGQLQSPIPSEYAFPSGL